MNKLFLTFLLLTTTLIHFDLRGELDGYYDDPFEEYALCTPYYLGIFGGADFVVSSRDFKVNFDPYPLGGAYLGYKFYCFRVEGEFSYRRAYLSEKETRNGSDLYAGLLNFYIDFPLFPLTPFIGLGGGYGHETGTYTYELPVFPQPAADDTTSPRTYTVNRSSRGALAWQAMFGVNYRILETTDIGLKTSFFDANGRRFHQDIVFTLTRYF